MKHDTMEKFLRIAVLVGFFVLLVPGASGAATFQHGWSQRFGDASQQQANAVAVDASGNVIIAGDFEGVVNFGGGNLTSMGGSDIFVAKFNAAGVHQWSQSFGDAFEEHGTSVAVDAAGNVIVAGDFEGIVDFGGGNLTSSGLSDFFIAKFSATGVHQWSKRFGDASDQIGKAAVDASGNVLAAGRFRGAVNFGGANLTSAGLWDVFVAKFDAAGVHQWSQSFGDAVDQFATSVSVDAAGRVAITGSFDGAVNFGGGALTTAGSWDVFVAQFNAAGVHQWSHRYGDSALQQGVAVASGASGDVVITGAFSGAVNFGGGILTSVGSGDRYVVKLDAAGVHQWSQNSGFSSSEAGVAIVLDAADDVIIASLDLVGFDFDLSVHKMNPAGAPRWSTYQNGALNQQANAVAVDASGNVFITGTFEGTVNFGGGNLTSTGAGDVFLAKLTPGPDPTIVDITDVGNDQGGQVRIRFERSSFDAAASITPVLQYEAYLRSDPLPSAFAAPASPFAAGNLLAPGWTFVGAVPAHAEGFYEIYAPTLADSTVANGQHWSVFYLRAATDGPFTFYDSDPDSGYSLDNLGPAAPLAFTFVAGQLTWDASDAPDFDHFSVYGSHATDFGDATLVDYTSGTSLDVTASPYAVYFVTATDRSGNEGAPAMALASPGTDTDAPKHYVLSVSAYPSPFNPETTIRYTLPAEGRVTIAIYDARGARVATLLDEDKPAGAFTLPWNGRDGAGRPASSGVYFARIEFGNEMRAYKMVLLK